MVYIFMKLLTTTAGHPPIHFCYLRNWWKICPWDVEANLDCCCCFPNLTLYDLVHLTVPTVILTWCANGVLLWCQSGPWIDSLSNKGAPCIKWLAVLITWKANVLINTLRPRQNRRHFADDVFLCNFLNENAWIPIKISLTFVPKGPINNIPALVQIMAWRRTSDKPLSEPMMVRLLTHICVIQPQWVNTLGPRWNGHLLTAILLIDSCIFVQFSLIFVPKGLINTIAALVVLMAWH